MSLFDLAYLIGPEALAWERYASGVKQYRGDLLEEAAESFRDAYRLDPSFRRALLYISFSHSRKGDYREAAAQLRDYTDRWPKDYWGHKHFGDALASSHQSEEAKNAYDRAIELDPIRPEALAAKGRLYLSAGQWEDAITVLETSAAGLAEAPDANSSYVHYLLGFAYYHTNRYDDALPSLLSAHDKYADDGRLNLYLGYCFLLKRDPNRSIAAHYFRIAERLGQELTTDIRSLIEKEKKITETPIG